MVYRPDCIVVNYVFKQKLEVILMYVIASIIDENAILVDKK